MNDIQIVTFNINVLDQCLELKLHVSVIIY